MYLVKDSIHIQAPLERCFLLSTNVVLASRSTGLHVVLGKKSGGVAPGDSVLWRGWICGFPLVHQTVVTKYSAPTFFRDTMQRGRFKFFQHDHHFAEVDGHTFLHDKVRFSMPYGWPGRLIARKIVIPYLTRLLRRRFSILKQVAESGEWRAYVPE